MVKKKKAALDFSLMSQSQKEKEFRRLAGILGEAKTRSIIRRLELEEQAAKFRIN